MSKISFTVSVPHEGPHIPQLAVSCNNATFLSFKGKDVKNARWGNGNVVPKKGWKRLEFGVLGSHASTRFTVILNTSVILPPLAWSTPGPAPAASVARGGSSATKHDLRAERRRMEKLEDGKNRLRIEEGDTGSEQQENRSRRGERVRRSERRRRREEDLSPLRIVEERYEDERLHDKIYYQPEERRARRRSNATRPDDEYWEDVPESHDPHRDHYNDYHDRRRRRSPISETSSNRRRVSGRKIDSKYRNPDRVYTGRDNDRYRRDYERESSRRDRELKQSNRRSQRRGSLKPVDWGFDPDIDDGPGGVDDGGAVFD